MNRNNFLVGLTLRKGSELSVFSGGHESEQGGMIAGVLAGK